MNGREYNNDFFGWDGFIARKNYAVNLLIVLGLFAGLSLINFNAFEPYIPFKFLLTALIFTADLLRLVLVMCALSLVYRRIADFTVYKSYKIQSAAKNIFIIVYVLPVLYILCARYFLSFAPAAVKILDLITFFVFIPSGLLCAVIFAFIKGKSS